MQLAVPGTMAFASIFWFGIGGVRDLKSLFRDLENAWSTIWITDKSRGRYLWLIKLHWRLLTRKKTILKKE